MAFNFIKRLFTSAKPKNKILSGSQDTLAERSNNFAEITAQSVSETSIEDDDDYQALATSFNDFLLGEQGQSKLTTPNEIEAFIIKNLEALLQGEIPDAIVPRLPDVAMTLLKELTDINVNAEAILMHINRDPVLASDVLKMSNSALFRRNSQEPIVNLNKAVVILGLDNLKAIVSSVLMKRLVSIAPVYFHMFGQHLWQHSLDCAQACRALALFYGRCDPNNAYLVGLMHDIGKLAIFGLLTKALGQYLDYKPRGSVFSTIIRDHSQALSAKIAQKWTLPDYCVLALTEQLGGYAEGDCSIYGFILNQANILAEFKPIAEKSVQMGESLQALLTKYSIPLHLYQEAFPESYCALVGID